MKIIDTLDNCKIPTWAFPAIFNSDESGLFGNDITFLYAYYAWLDKNAKDIGAGSWVIVQDDENQDPYFDTNPEFGMPCDVLDCTISYFE